MKVSVQSDLIVFVRVKAVSRRVVFLQTKMKSILKTDVKTIIQKIKTMSLIVIALIFTILLLSILVLYIIDSFRGKGVPDGNVIVFYSFMFSLGILILLGFSLNEPKAIDVYRGKTTLEITYKDKVPIDSIVVWKK